MGLTVARTSRRRQFFILMQDLINIAGGTIGYDCLGSIYLAIGRVALAGLTSTAKKITRLSC